MVIQEKNEGAPPVSAIWNDPYEVVAATFSGFEAPHRRNSGGIVRAGKPIVLAKELGPDQISEGYHVEMTFTEGQRAYVVAAMGLYNRLLGGKTITPTTRNYPRLSERMTNYRAQGYDLPVAMTYGTLDTIYDFKVLHPNLMPAMDAVFKLAGTDGTIAAIQNANHIVEARLLPIIGVPDQIRHRSFVNGHRSTPKGTFDYEVVCAGEAVAKTMIDEAAMVADRFGPSIQGVNESDLRLRINRQVSHLAEQVAERHEKKLSPEFF